MASETGSQKLDDRCVQSTPYCQHTTFPRGGRHPLSVIFLWAEWRYFDFELHPWFNTAGRAASNLDMQTMIENTIKNTMIENTMNTLDKQNSTAGGNPVSEDIANIDFTPVRF